MWIGPCFCAVQAGLASRNDSDLQWEHSVPKTIHDMIIHGSLHGDNDTNCESRDSLTRSNVATPAVDSLLGTWYTIFSGNSGDELFVS